jgi:hypothetical protein
MTGTDAAALEIARKEYQLKSRDHARTPVQVSNVLQLQGRKKASNPVLVGCDTECRLHNRHTLDQSQ